MDSQRDDIKSNFN